jgi:phage tail sheath protein FI
MAEKIVSPGVFTNEKDLSFLPAGVAQIGGAFVGSATKGPAFVPTALNSFTEFETIFGKTNSNYYMPYSVRDYITNGGRATVVRIMPSEGYSLNQGLVGVYASAQNAASSLGVGASKVNQAVSSSLAAAGIYTLAEVNAYTGSAQLLFTLHPTKKQTSTAYYSLTSPTQFFDNALASYTLVAGASNLDSSSFTLVLSGSGATSTTYTVNALSSTDNNFTTKLFGITPQTSNDPVYLYHTFKNAATSYYTSNANTSSLFAMLPSGSVAGTVSASIVFSGDRRTGASGQYHTYASTPWIISQTVNGINNQLFKFHTLSEGTNANYEVKIGISNIRPAGTVPGTEYGDFTVTVRAVDQSLVPGSPFTTIDSDTRPNILETYTQCNLDPSSKNFIARKIGDKYRYFDTENLRAVVTGDYDNLSKYVRVEVSTKVFKGSYSTALVPFGFEALYNTLPLHFYSANAIADINGTARTFNAAFPPAKYKTNQKDANNVYNKKVHFGFDYDFSGTDNLNYLKPIPNDATTGINKNFLLSNYNQDAGATTAGTTGSIDLTTATSIESRKFIVPFQFGFDGTYPNKEILTGANITATNTQGYNVNTPSADGYLAFKYGIDAVGSATSVDINMLVCPGIIYSLHPAIVSYAEQVAQDRGDTFFVFDAAALDATVQDTVDAIADWDSNYAATYYPWVKIVDQNTTKPLWVPPSVVVPGVLAYNDKVGEQWFAPAGLNRGSLPNVIDAYSRLSRTEIDTLYDGRVNPLATLPGLGITVWGQKTLQAKPSALDRINVRRLLIALKKFIASSTQYLVFEQNTSATRNRFLNIVNPYMESVQQRSGVYAFKVVMDDTNNTPDLIDRNIMYGQIYIQPTRTAEFIIIDFNILPTGATFGA